MHGNLTRRNFVLAGSIAAVSPLLAQPGMAQAGSIVTRRLNNFMISVSDMDRSTAFYQKLFGAPAVQDNVAIFRVGGGPHFFGLTPVKAGAQPQFLSYGLTVENFDPRV